MKSITIIFVTVISFSVLLGFAWLIEQNNQFVERTTVPQNDPIDVVDEFFGGWLNARQTTASTSLENFLLSQPNVSPAVRERLLARSQIETKDVLLCQDELPQRIGVKPVFVTERSAQVLVLMRGESSGSGQPIVDLALVQNEWVVTDIACSVGETGVPIGEYTFEQLGRLAKDSLPDQYDQTMWHLLFTNEIGDAQIVPLFFDETSQCADGDRIAACAPDTFAEGTIAYVQANMIEAGATVGRMELE